MYHTYTNVIVVVLLVHCIRGGGCSTKCRGEGVYYSALGGRGWYVLLCVATGMSVWYTECMLTMI